MAGNCKVACAEGLLSLAKERGSVRRKRLHQFDITRPSTPSSQPPTSCGWLGLKALQIVCFSLVTLTGLLY